jgi:hypothetical protein
MSRGQEDAVAGTSAAQNEGYYNNAQTSYGDAQTDIGNYETQLGQYASDVNKFAGENPYTAGGEFAKDQTQILTNTSDAGASSEKAALQDQALRTGQNMGGANATAESISEANERNLSGQEAQADQTRTADEAAYNNQTLSAQQQLTSDTAVPAQMESSLYNGSATAGNAALGIDEKASETPSFWEGLMANAEKGAGTAATMLVAG